MKTIIFFLFSITSIFAVSGSPLSELNSFSFLVAIPNDLQREQVIKEINATLKDKGKLVVTKTSKKMNLQGLDSDTMGAISIKPVYAFGSKKEILQLSISISAQSTINRTKAQAFPEIWREDIYISADDKADISKKFKELLDLFVSEYSKANATSKTKPVFYVYD